MQCALRRASSFWKACMRTGGSAGRWSGGLWRKSGGVRPNPSRNRRPSRTIFADNARSDNSTEECMKWVRFSKYTGEDFGIDAQDLMQALADFFLQSGFQSQFMQFTQWD